MSIVDWSGCKHNIDIESDMNADSDMLIKLLVSEHIRWSGKIIPVNVSKPVERIELRKTIKDHRVVVRIGDVSRYVMGRTIHKDMDISVGTTGMMMFTFEDFEELHLAIHEAKKLYKKLTVDLDSEV